MTTWDIIIIAMFAWLAFDRLVTEVGSVLRARARGRDCPCSSIGALIVEPGVLVPGKVEDAARNVH